MTVRHQTIVSCDACGKAVTQEYEYHDDYSDAAPVGWVMFQYQRRVQGGQASSGRS